MRISVRPNSDASAVRTIAVTVGWDKRSAVPPVRFSFSESFRTNGGTALALVPPYDLPPRNAASDVVLRAQGFAFLGWRVAGRRRDDPLLHPGAGWQRKSGACSTSLRRKTRIAITMVAAGVEMLPCLGHSIVFEFGLRFGGIEIAVPSIGNDIQICAAIEEEKPSFVGVLADEQVGHRPLHPPPTTWRQKSVGWWRSSMGEKQTTFAPLRVVGTRSM
jgi:hypothetical protein